MSINKFILVLVKNVLDTNDKNSVPNSAYNNLLGTG